MIENEDNEKRTRPVLMKIETISNDTNNKKNVFKIRIAKYVDMRIYGNLVMRFPVEWCNKVVKLERRYVSRFSIFIEHMTIKYKWKYALIEKILFRWSMMLELLRNKMNIGNEIFY